MQVKEYKEFDLSFIKITNDDNFEVVLCNLGASIFSIKFDDKLMTHTLSNANDLKRKDIYHGKVIGPTAGRIFSNHVLINKKEYSLPFNENDICFLHGGDNGISNSKFRYQIEKFQWGYLVNFVYYQEEDKAVLPGNVYYNVRYAIYRDKPILSFDIVAISDKRTMLNVTNHPYFNLGENNLDNLKLKINSKQYLSVDRKYMRPLNKKEVSSCLDFSISKPIMKDINAPLIKNSATNGYDHYFYFDEHRFFDPQVELESDNYILKIMSDAPGVQIYTSNYEKDVNFVNEDRNINQSIAIEFEKPWCDENIVDKNTESSVSVYYEFVKKEVINEQSNQTEVSE